MNFDEDVLKCSLELCQKVTARVEALANKLQSEIHKCRCSGTVQKAVKRRDMDALLLRLDRSKMDSHFAYSIYMDAWRQKESETIIVAIAEAGSSQT